MAHAVTIQNSSINLDVNLDDKSYVLFPSPPISVLVSKTFGIDLTGININLSTDVSLNIYDTNNNNFMVMSMYLSSNIYNTEDELIFDFENGVIYYGENVITDDIFAQYHKNITSITLSFS